jgi:hypothetical protein
MPHRVGIAILCGKTLAGRNSGRRAFGQLCGALCELPRGERAVLDFRTVDVVTASWINAALVPLLDWSSTDDADLYPLIYGIGDDFLDELRLVAENSHSCFLQCNDIKATRAKLVGSLDAGQAETLRAVTSTPGVTGAELERLHPEVKATAWNNRLKDLFVKRLLRRERRGREQVYSPVVLEVDYRG